jgi:23S rRNA (uracil1939-C5)-methyltransferase
MAILLDPWAAVNTPAVESPPFPNRSSLMPQGLIESMDHEARGITRLDGKTIFVEGALPGETVDYTSFRRKPSYEIAVAERVVRASSQRVEPRCPHFGVCGGCSMQHVNLAAQVAIKQRVLEDNLWHLSRLKPERFFPAIYGEPWGYRHRARLGVRNVPKKGGVLVGFHERRSSYIADMKSCAILPPRVSDLLLPLRALVESLSIRERLPQIEVSHGARVLALVLRVLEEPTAADRERMVNFARETGTTIYLQPKGPDSVVRLWPAPDDATAPELSYELAEHAVEMFFTPTDFTQVNHRINEVLVRRAMSLLQPAAGERIADLFCGLGNFTLPIARTGATVFGVEGSAALIRRAGENARRNGLAARVAYDVANLFEVDAARLAAWGPFDKMLIDPPREGAIEVVKALPDAGAPSRIVYVSCNPATLARDAAVLVHQKGYALKGAGVVNMFPQTSHVESIALFER